MARLLTVVPIAIFLLVVSTQQMLAQGDQRSAVEATVRTWEQSCANLDFDKANSTLAPGARWIYASPPEAAEFNGKGSSKRWEEYKAAKLRIDYQLQDIETRIQGDVAWVTLTLHATFTADNEAARALNSNQQEWRGTFIESIVLAKTGKEWKITLGHSSLLPEKR